MQDFDGFTAIDLGLGAEALDLEAFDLTDGLAALDLGGDGLSGSRYVKPRFSPGVPAHAVKYERAEQLVADVGTSILAGERVDALVSGNFIFGDIFEALAVKHNLLMSELIVSTLSISQENVDSLRNLLVGGYLERLDVIVSDYFWSHNRQNAAYIYDNLDVDDRFQLSVAGVHTKIALMRVGEQKIVVHGSANFRSSRSIETFTVETNPDIYDFHREWKMRIIERGATIDKSKRRNPAKALRASKLWQAVAPRSAGPDRQ